MLQKNKNKENRLTFNCLLVTDFAEMYSLHLHLIKMAVGCSNERSQQDNFCQPLGDQNTNLNFKKNTRLLT